MEGSYKLNNKEVDIIKHNSQTTQDTTLIDSQKSSQIENKPDNVEKKKTGPKLLMCTTLCKYKVVKKAAKNLDFKLNDDDTLDWDIYWSDTTLPSNKVQKMQPYQRINHFPGMPSLSHKHNLSRNLKKMYKLYENEYDFFP